FLAAAAVLDDRLSAVGADQLLSAGRQHRLRLLRHLWDHPQRDPGRSRQGDRDPRLQGLVRRHGRPRSRQLGDAIGHSDGDRHRADRDPVPLYRTPSSLCLGWQFRLLALPIVIPGRRAAASPESIFQRPVFMDSGPRPLGDPGMTFVDCVAHEPRMMVTARRSAWLPHAVLIAGLALVLFPIYVAFVGSTLTAQDILDAPMSLVPGPHLFENFGRALGSGTVKTSGEPGAAMLLNSLVMALVIAGGKILISLPSAYAVVFFRFPLRRLCFWA